MERSEIQVLYLRKRISEGWTRRSGGTDGKQSRSRLAHFPSKLQYGVGKDLIYARKVKVKLAL